MAFDPPAPPATEEDPPRTEIELKLLLDPAHVARLRRHPTLRTLSQGRAVTRALHTVYYDTAEQDLLRADLTLRVRRVGRGHVQTVKVRGDGGAAGLFERIEVESPVPGSAPDPSRIPDSRLRARVERCLRGRPLEPILETDFRRSERRLREGDTEIALALDTGCVRTPRGEVPLCELELELVQGDGRTLYDLALELLDGVPLRIGTQAKFDRGLALLTGERPAPQGARRVRFEPGASVEQAIEAILVSCIEQILANEEPALDGSDPEGVHQMRVGVRRLRSALSLWKEMLPAEQAEPLRRDLRWLGGELGPARDLDVFLQETLGGLLQGLPDEPDLKRLRDAAEELRTEAYERARTAILSRRFTAAILHLGRFVAARGWRQQSLSPESARLFQPAAERAAVLLARRRKKVRRLGRGIRERSVPEKHELRIQLKKLRYAAEFLRELYPGRRPRRLLRRVGRLQDVLGRLNDVAAAERILGQVLERIGDELSPGHLRAAGFVLGWVARGADEELDQLPRLWKAYRRARPFWT